MTCAAFRLIKKSLFPLTLFISQYISQFACRKLPFCLCLRVTIAVHNTGGAAVGSKNSTLHKNVAVTKPAALITAVFASICIQNLLC